MPAQPVASAAPVISKPGDLERNGAQPHFHWSRFEQERTQTIPEFSSIKQRDVHAIRLSWGQYDPIPLKHSSLKG